MKLLHLDSSISAENSASRPLSAAIVKHLHGQHPGLSVTHHDFAKTPIPYLASVPARAEAAEGPWVKEFMAADLIVIGAPMYNFGIPAQLKTWLDYIAVPGGTFKYGANGPEGFCAGKKVYIASSRGGIYSTGPAAGLDHQESHLRAVFQFLGVKPDDIHIIHIEGTGMGPEQREKSTQAALAEVAKL